MLENVEKLLYLGSKHSKLSGLMKLYNVKGRYEWSHNEFLTLLKVLNKTLPNDNNFPWSIYEAKKILEVLGLDYEKIHAFK